MITIIGYGNPLREDDGLGWEAAWSLEGQWPESDVRILTRHQLMPELAEDVAASSLVIFIDARVDGTPGEIQQYDIEVKAPDGGAFTHTVTPSGLLGLAQVTYGQAARGVLLTVGGASFGFGDKLTDTVADALEKVRMQVTTLVDDERGEATVGTVALPTRHSAAS